MLLHHAVKPARDMLPDVTAFTVVKIGRQADFFASVAALNGLQGMKRFSWLRVYIL